MKLSIFLLPPTATLNRRKKMRFPRPTQVWIGGEVEVIIVGASCGVGGGIYPLWSCDYFIVVESEV
jgi:hypothetical protein